MSTTITKHDLTDTPSSSGALGVGASRLLLMASIALVLAAAIFASALPIGFSILTVFLFAGPHNWLEARYMLSQMPARWGKLRAYFLTGICGALLLTGAAACLPSIAIAADLSAISWNYLLSTWNTALLLWILAMILMRSRQNPRRSWEIAIPITFVLIAINWLYPAAIGMLLVYLHPLLALAFLDRELARRDRQDGTTLQQNYRRALLLVPIALALIIGLLWRSPNLPGDDLLSQAITLHAGQSVFQYTSTHMLVAVHTFLEMLHYGVWVVAIPILAIGRWPWQLEQVPLAKRSSTWRTIVLGVIALGACVMVLLWGSFLADYPLTRNLYFTIAMLHVLAEVPFFLRLL